MNEHYSRRNFLKTSSLATGVGLLAPKPKAETIIGHGTHRYRVVPNWGILDAGQNPVNDCHEMVEDAKGRLFLLTNETQNNVLIYDKSGKLLDSWGHDYPGAHGLTIGNEGGEQYLLICDTERHQVLKTDLKGRELMKIDYPKESGVYAHPTKFKPTETCINPANGDIYVADGYGSNYIIQYNAKGQYIRHFGGSGDAHELFACCHGIVVDTRKANAPTLLVTSRVHNMFKRFTLDGRFVSTIHLPGTYVCRPVLHGQHIFAAAYRSTAQDYPNSGYVTILDQYDRVISTPGGSAPVYQNGQLQEQRKDRSFLAFMHPHDVYVDSDENLYVCQWNSKKTYPIKLERV